MDQELVVTPEDAQYVLSMLDSLSGLVEYRRIEFHAYVEVSIETIDLDAMGQTLFGVTDPIGQLQSWLYDRLKELSSWFASTVDSLIDALWTNLIKPTLEAISAGIAWLESAVDNIASAINAMGSVLSQIAETVAQIPSTVVDAIETFASTIQNTIADIVSAVESAIKGVVDAIVPAIQSVASAVQNAVGAITKAISDLAGQISAGFQQVVKGVSEALAPLIQTISAGFQQMASYISDFAAQVVGAIQALPEMIISGIQEFVGAIQEAVESIGESVWSALKAVQEALSGLAESIAEWFAGVADAIKGGLDWLAGYIEGAIKGLSDAIAGALKAVQDAFTSAMQTVASWMQQASAAITGFVNAILKFPEWFPVWFYENIAKPIQEGLAWLADQIWKLLPDWLKGAIIGLQKAWESFVQGLQDFLRDPLGFIQRGFSWLAEQIWNLLPDWLKGAITAIQEAWSNFVQGLQDFLEDPLGFIQRGFSWLAEQIWKLLPEWFKAGVEKVREFIESIWKWVVEDLPAFLTWVWEGLQALAEDPWGWFQKNVLEPAWRAVDWILDRLQEGIAWLAERMRGFWDAVVRGVTWIADAIGSAVQMFAGLVRAAGEAVWRALSGFAQWIAGAVEGAIKAVVDPIRSFVSEQVKKIMAGEGGEVEFMVGMAATATVVLMPILFLGDVLKGVARALDRIGLRATLALEPLGIGGEGAFRIMVKLTTLIEEIAERLKHAPEKFIEGAMTATAIAAMWPLQYTIGYAWRQLLWTAKAGDIIWRLPAESEVRELTKRALPQTYKFKIAVPKSEILGIAYDFGTLLDYAKTYMVMGGLPLAFIEPALAPEDEFHVAVKDRFKKERKIPLSLIYTIPTASDVAGMAVRDIFRRYEDFAAAFAARGMTPDVAALYYLYRFKYPSPERLAEFYWRGVAKVLWSPGLPKDPEMLEDLKKLGVGFKPKAPKALNAEPETLNRMMATYMKWHDYFPVAWEEGFPADIDIIHDLMADIPTKIDIRWMVRWALLEQLSKAGFGMESAIELLPGIMKSCKGDELYSEKVTAGIAMDVSVMARLIESTGMHPYWTPLVAVAEAINALADEKTLIRTGFINAYEEGLVTLDNTEQLLSGLFVTTFKTGYIDPATGKPVTFNYNVPLAWLPAERRLLQIRAVFDRSIALFREGYREIAKAVRYLIWTPEEAHKRLGTFAEFVTKYLKAQLKALTGTDVPISVDETYLDAWLATESLISEIELGVRLRLLAQRILGWVLYRVAYGWVTVEDLKRIADVLIKRFEFTEQEAAAVLELATVMAGIAAREWEYEYIPTLGTLASMMEYIDVPRELILKVFEERRVKEPWASLWYRYALTRSIATETNAMVSTFRGLLERYAVPEDIVNRVMAIMRQGGWTSRELQIFNLDVTLRRIRRILDTFVPTLREFMGDAMYLGEWERLLEDWLLARGIEAEKYKAQVEYYKKLIKSRKINRRLSWYISRLMNAYCAGVITLEEAKRQLEQFKTFGLDDDEIKILLAGFQLERKYREAIYGSPSAGEVGR